MTPISESDRTVAALDTILDIYQYVTVKNDGKFTVFIGHGIYKTEIEVSAKTMSGAILKAAETVIQ